MHATQRRATSQARSSKELSGGFVVLVFVALGFWLYHHTAPSDSPAQSQHAATQQESFESIRGSRLSAYEAATNEIQKSAIFNEANAQDGRYFATHGSAIDEWTGSITRMRTSHGGADVDVEITSASNTVYRQNSIALGTALYEQLRSIPEGASVIFTGEFEKGFDGKVSEGSLTEVGSLREPTFDVNISSIRISGSPRIIDQPTEQAASVSHAAPSATSCSTNVRTTECEQEKVDALFEKMDQAERAKNTQAPAQLTETDDPEVRKAQISEYAAAIQSAVAEHWVKPDNLPAAPCVVHIVQLPGGKVVSATVDSNCPYGDSGRLSVENAVLQTGSLPYVGFESVFQRKVDLAFKG